MALEQASGTFIAIDVLNRARQSSPTTSVLGVLRIRCLKKNLDTVKWRDDSFRLNDRPSILAHILVYYLTGNLRALTAHPAIPPAKPLRNT